MLGKRSCIPEGNTPGKKKTKRKRNGKGNTVKKSLFDNNMIQGDGQKFVNDNGTVWVTAELAALVQHICMYWDRAANYCRTSDNVRLNLANVRAKVILIGHWSDHKRNCHILHFFCCDKIRLQIHSIYILQ